MKKNEQDETAFGSNLVIWAHMLAYFRYYPDKFLDYISPPDSTFRLYPFQRLYLRIMARYRITYLVATRGTSKSFLNILFDYIKCILYPNIKLSMLAPQKGQASNIAQANIENIWNFFPVLKKEVKKYAFQNDYTKLVFWNGSELDIIPVAEGARGLRKNGLSFEEIVNMEKHRETIGSVILPLLANNRKGADGRVSTTEIHKQIKYITTASDRQTYAWDTLFMVLKNMAFMVDKPKEAKKKTISAFAIGNDYELPVLFEQLDINYINETREDPSVSPLDFAREYTSDWTKTSQDSLVSRSDLEDARINKKPDLKDERTNAEKKNTNYYISVDVARSERDGTANTSIAVIKTKERTNGTYYKELVYMKTYRGAMHFQSQARAIKDLVELYNASMVIVDANTLGSGLVDFLIIKEGKYPAYSVVNDKDYDKYKQPNSLPLVFNLKSNSKETNASDIHNNFMAVVAKKDLKLLVSDKEAEEHLSKKEKEELGKHLAPYIETSRFIDEVMNLKYIANGHKTKVERVSSQMEKDRYSSVSYGLFYIYLLEKQNLAKRNRSSNSNPMRHFAQKKAKFKVFD